VYEFGFREGGEARWRLSRGEKEWNRVEGENFVIRCCQVASHEIGSASGRFLLFIFV
jgi:hypothetical protein